MKILIAGGDSNADKRFRSTAYPSLDTSWPKWPELLSEKLNMRTCNTARGGAGNEYIFSRLQSEIMHIEDKSQIGLVVAGWTQCHRQDWQLDSGNTVFSWASQRVHDHGHLIGWMRKTLRYQLALKIMCDAFNIPLIQFHMIHPYDDYIHGLQPVEADLMFGGKKLDEDREKYPGNYEKDMNKLVSVILAYDKHLGQDGKFIGWPVSNKWQRLYSKVDEDGNDLGFPLDYHLWWEKRLEDRGYLEYVISDLDVHPSTKGQLLITEFLHGELEKIYGNRLG